MPNANGGKINQDGSRKWCLPLKNRIADGACINPQQEI